MVPGAKAPAPENFVILGGGFFAGGAANGRLECALAGGKTQCTRRTRSEMSSGTCRVEGACRGGLDDELPCPFDTNCRRDSTPGLRDSAAGVPITID